MANRLTSPFERATRSRGEVTESPRARQSVQAKCADREDQPT